MTWIFIFWLASCCCKVFRLQFRWQNGAALVLCLSGICFYNRNLTFCTSIIFIKISQAFSLFDNLLLVTRLYNYSSSNTFYKLSFRLSKSHSPTNVIEHRSILQVRACMHWIWNLIEKSVFPLKSNSKDFNPLKPYLVFFSKNIPLQRLSKGLHWKALEDRTGFRFPKLYCSFSKEKKTETSFDRIQIYTNSYWRFAKLYVIGIQF